VLGAGFGSDFILGEQFSAGLEIRYVYAFEQTVKINNADVKLIQSFNDIMARFAYRF
jgi:hypothetical protein